MPSFSIHKLQPANAHLTEQLRAYAYDVIGCCQVVHRDMGPFLNEYMYQEALAIAFNEANILQWGPQRKPNAVFAMGRAGSSEYSLPKRNFGTCTRIDHASSMANPSSTSISWTSWSAMISLWSARLSSISARSSANNSGTICASHPRVSASCITSPR